MSEVTLYSLEEAKILLAYSLNFQSTVLDNSILQSGYMYRVASLIRNRHPVGPYRRTMPRLLWRS